MVRIGVISDTHGYLDPLVHKHFKECDEIWHAGDIGDLSVTDELKTIAPVRAVYGNIDGHQIRREFPYEHRWNCEGVDVWMLHIGGKPYVYNKFTRDTMRQRPPQLFVCGHSHILLIQFDKRAQCLCLNPGAAGKKGFHKTKTLVRFSIDKGQMRDMEVVELGPRASEVDQ